MRVKKMNVLVVTYCSAKKATNAIPMPSIERYLSTRISRVFREARRLGAEYRTLSGKFGLLAPNDRIPYYDHLLSHEEVLPLSHKVAKQLRKARVRKVLYFTELVAVEPQVEPYAKTIERACALAKIQVEAYTIDSLNSTKNIVKLST